jgi:phosphatidylglycerol:prolipoprotein diacylglycerol transferase
LAFQGNLVAVSSYSVFIYLAAAITVAASLAMAARRGLPVRKVSVILLAMAIATLVGARLFHAFTNGDSSVAEFDWSLNLTLGRFSLYGGLLLAGAVGLLACRLLRVDVKRLADSVAPGLGIGIATARIGCYLAGCCFGNETDLPWAVVFPFGSNAHLNQIVSGFLFFSREPLPAHPTQLYEFAAGLVGALVAVWLLHRRYADGTTFLVFIVWFSAFRWLNHYLRADSATTNTPEWIYPALYCAIIVTCLVLLLRPHHEMATSLRQRFARV